MTPEFVSHILIGKGTGARASRYIALAFPLATVSKCCQFH